MIYLTPIKFKILTNIYYNKELFFFNKKKPAKLISILKNIIKYSNKKDIFIAPDIEYNNKFYIPLAKAITKYSINFKILYFSIDKFYIAYKRHQNSNFIIIVPQKKSKFEPIISNKTYSTDSVNALLTTYFQNLSFLELVGIKKFNQAFFL